MSFRSLCLLPVAILFAGQAFAAPAPPELQIRALKPGAVVTVDRLVGDDKVLLSVTDAASNPLQGLLNSDFSVTKGGRTAKIVSVQPIAESLEVPRHFVLVLDNSDSMRQRHAIEPLLAGVDELLKIVRPIDQVEVVVFDSKQTVTMGGRSLHVRSFRSNNPVELKSFVSAVYRDAMTPTTVLYEAMLAGLDLVKAMPAGEPRFMVVFSDGEDLNSAYARNDVSKAAEGMEKFDVYAIDYLPGPATDKFLEAFARKNRGEIWKATSAANFVPIFQSVASRMQYYYVVNYLFPATGLLTIAPDTLTIDELRTVAPRQAEGEPPVVRSLTSSLDATQLVLRPVADSVYGFAGWKVTVSNTDGRLAELSGAGSPPAEIPIPLDAGSPAALVAGGDITVTMELNDRKGQNFLLAASPVKVNLLRTTASLEVAPAVLNIEEIKTLDASPMLGHIYFAEGSGELPPQYVRLAGPESTTGFDARQFRDTLDKYYQVLNIVGLRLRENPEATVTLVGCNANYGVERGKKGLSNQRAEAVRDYLLTIWGVAPERITVEARNLPEMPSTSRLDEGRADNRRVEIRSDHPAILDLVRSSYLATRIDAAALTLHPVVDSPRGVASWQVVVNNAAGNVAGAAREGAPPTVLTIPLPTGQLADLAAAGEITVNMTILDRKGQQLTLAPDPVKVNFIQTSQRLAEKQDFRVQEKYALILFDFDSDAIDARNRSIVDAIVARIRELPQATVEIVGHTDNIGKESYNLKLSERRAGAVYKALLAAFGEDPGERVRFRGVGSETPLYENVSSETRAFNRTVTITLEYLATE